MTKNLEEHTITDRSDHEKAKYIIAMRLSLEHRGRENAISSAELAEHTPVSASTVRDLVPVVTEEFRLPIGNANGYFLIESKREYQRQVKRQLKQAETSKERAASITAAWHRSVGGDE